MRTSVIGMHLPPALRRFFWDHCQCPATLDRPSDAGWPGMRVTVYCGRIRFHLGRHYWP